MNQPAGATQGRTTAEAAPAKASRRSGERAVLAALAVAAVGSAAMLGVAVARLGPDMAETRVTWAVEPAETVAAMATAGVDAAPAVVLADDALPPPNRLASAAASAVEVVPDPAQLATSGNEAAVASPAGEIPRHERWEIVFPAGLTEVDYAVQLDALGIELGVLWPDGQIEYVTAVSQLMPMRRKAAAADERRFYLSWGQGDLAAADQKLLAKAGVEGAPPLVLHYLSQTAESRLAELEQAFAGRAAGTIYRTQFGVRMGKGGYEFYVVEQQPRG
jgi:hypothetical protein